MMGKFTMVLAALTLGVGASSGGAQETVQLPREREVPLLVLKEMGTGVTKEGTPVILAVERDITDNRGRVLIGRGTPVLAVVTWSRHDAPLRNRPARLNIRVEHTYTVDGRPVKLLAGNRRTFHGFNGRDRPVAAPDRRDEPSENALQELWNNKETRPVLTALVDKLTTGKTSPVLSDPGKRDVVNLVAQRLGLSRTRDFVERGGLRNLTILYQSVLAGNPLQPRPGYSPTQTLMATAQAINEVLRFGRWIGRRIPFVPRDRGDFSVQPGVRVPARTDEAVTVRLPASPEGEPAG